ncbi:MAG: ATP-binding protein [Haloplanus sp.]
MDRPGWERRLAAYAPSTVAILGGTVAVVSVANFFRTVGSRGGVGVVPVLSLCLGVFLSIGMVGLARWLSRSELPVHGMWTVVRWSLGGTVAFATLAMVTVLLRLAEGRRVGGAALVVLVMGAGGGLGGGLTGIYYARATRAVREADRRRDALVFLNSHLRHNVLNATQVIQGYADLLESHTDDSGRRYLRPIDRRSTAIADLIDDVKQLADVFAGTQSPAPMDVSTTLLREVASVREDTPDATIEVDVPGEVQVLATDAVSAVFGNLLRNAVEHNDKDHPEVSVDVAVSDATVTVRIADNGPGIRTEVRESLFESAIESGEGRGIALVKTLMNHYGGDVEVRDNDPEGTVVLVRFRRPVPGS